MEDEIENDSVPHPNDHPDLQPVGKVVGILEHSGHDTHIGYLKPFRRSNELQKSDKWVRFVPLDSRVPQAFFPKRECFKEFLDNPSGNHKDRYLKVKYLPWKDTQRNPGCEFLEEAGRGGNIDVETEVILSVCKVSHRADFPDEVENYVREKYGDWQIPAEEYEKRMDCRDMRIFSIDPPTARDLDDALSVEKLPNGNYKVGVHIADVTYFVKPGDPIDDEARKRCTSVYLVHKVIPMLPRLLCEKLCSLNPGVDRLAYSVFMELQPNGLLNPDADLWFGRTIIKSCAKLDYGIALKALRGEIVDPAEIDKKYCPAADCTHTFEDMMGDINMLWALAKAKRAWRFDTGSLTLDRVKLTFRLNEDLAPASLHPYTCAESNWLIEEFMLLANTSVAGHLLEKLPQHAFLRCHPPPNLRCARRMLAICKAQGIMISMETAGKLQQSLERLPRKLRRLVETLLTKPMMSAEYICTGLVDMPEGTRHYALNFPYYTHYTSPIRRYADVMVHRQLTYCLQFLNDLEPEKEKIPCPYEMTEQQKKEIRDILGRTIHYDKEKAKEIAEKLKLEQEKTDELLHWWFKQPENILESVSQYAKVAADCNEMKYNSKCAQDKSGILFLCFYVDKNPIKTIGTVVDIGTKSFTVCIEGMGIEHRVITQHVKKAKECSISGQMPKSVINIIWNDDTESNFRIFDDIHLKLTTNKNKTPMELVATPIPPSDMKEPPQFAPDSSETDKFLLENVTEEVTEEDSGIIPGKVQYDFD